MPTVFPMRNHYSCLRNGLGFSHLGTSMDENEKIEAEYVKWKEDLIMELPDSFPTVLLRMAFDAGWEAREEQA